MAEHSVKLSIELDGERRHAIVVPGEYEPGLAEKIAILLDQWAQDNIRLKEID